MEKQSPKAILLKDYRAPEFDLNLVELHFELDEESSRVHSRLHFKMHKGSGTLSLDGEKLELEKIAIDGRQLAKHEYQLDEHHLVLPQASGSFCLEITTRLEPQKNLSCEGLYRSGPAESAIFCTQCEAESFRRITFYPDRPDVMSIFKVTIEADKGKYPVLLSNGNRISSRDLAGGRHQVIWHDPFKKPSYLFALVAGQLSSLDDEFVTRSGRQVKLKIFARKGLQERCVHAMNSLKWSMKWDEDTYGLEYDLDVFMIVVAEDFNMGAMENKGLNIFNANYVLAKAETATDHDFQTIAAVVGHEYFHNWTGNRVTCRDWFQLSLKEGLTVYRDQRFSADLSSPAVNRINDVIHLRTHQFAEDAGPTAHPVRPTSYISIDNFYTMTIYEKGAEVIRMIETIVGRSGFRKGMDLYFKRHDGQAVTTEDFVAAMEAANSVDLTQFKNWYDQAGTPIVSVQSDYDAKAARLTLTLEQSCPPSPDQPVKKPFHIPIAIGLIGRTNGEMKPQIGRDMSSSIYLVEGSNTAVLSLKQPKQNFIFDGVNEKPVISLLRGFSAPIRCKFDYSDEELSFLIARDTDSFCRWEAAQVLTVRLVQKLVADFQAKRELESPEILIQAFQPLLKGKIADPEFVSCILSLPAEQYLAQFFATVDVDAVFAAREHIRHSLSKSLHAELSAIYAQLSNEDTSGMSQIATGRRALKNRVLSYLVLSGAPADIELATRQRREAQNMTEELGALDALNGTNHPARTEALNEFYAKWKSEPLVMNKWLTTQAISPLPGVLEEIRRLSRDPVFDANNPNKIYSLYAAFSRFNQVRFNDSSGAGYSYIADRVMEIDSRNPQVASRLMSGFGNWRLLDGKRQELIKGELQRVLAQPGLSSNVYELASKMLRP